MGPPRGCLVTNVASLRPFSPEGLAAFLPTCKGAVESAGSAVETYGSRLAAGSLCDAGADMRRGMKDSPRPHSRHPASKDSAQRLV